MDKIESNIKIFKDHYSIVICLKSKEIYGCTQEDINLLKTEL
jgi:hypothetical protein